MERIVTYNHKIYSIREVFYMIYLIVVAHPDDEVLGAGATIFKLANNGHTVNVCILSGEVNARDQRPKIDELQEDVEKSMKVLGVKKVIIGDFPNIEFNKIGRASCRERVS